MRTMNRIFALALLSLLGSTTAAAQSRSGSLYNPAAAPIRMGTTNTARRPGDLLTIMVSEDLQVKNEEKSDLQKVSGLDMALTDFNIKSDAFSVLPSLRGDRNDTFSGTANYEKKGGFNATLTVMVVDALPGGVMVIQGRREIRVDGEVKVIEISGMVRRYDVGSDNSVMSSKVADARITYSGSGPLTRATNRRGFGGWLHDIFDWIWPF
ncbi:MAG: flagellar L-ring protein precursor FlgH [Planctomycetota bacterium]|jgi:flagellar L-ring protein precursor FlgH